MEISNKLFKQYRTWKKLYNTCSKWRIRKAFTNGPLRIPLVQTIKLYVYLLQLNFVRTWKSSTHVFTERVDNVKVVFNFVISRIFQRRTFLREPWLCAKPTRVWSLNSQNTPLLIMQTKLSVWIEIRYIINNIILSNTKWKEQNKLHCVGKKVVKKIEGLL